MPVSDRSWSTAEAVARDSHGKLVAILSAQLGDLHSAEDALAEAFTKALDTWPSKGVPENPESWLITVAKRQFIDKQRSKGVAQSHETELQQFLEAQFETEYEEDPRIALLFVCTHPAIDPDIRTPLMLQAVLSVRAEDMAPLWLMKPATLGQRLGRAKTKISASGIPFTVPTPAERSERLGSVLDAIYAALTIQGGEFSLSLEAEYLAALLAAAFPEEAEVLGLFALCLFRMAIAEDQKMGPLSERDTKSWDRPRINRAEDALLRASKLRSPGRFQIEAAIQSAHIIGRLEERDVRDSVVTLYKRLIQYAPSIGASCGLAAALLDAGDITSAKEELRAVESQAQNYQPYWVVSARLCEATGDISAALTHLQKANSMTSDHRSKLFILEWVKRLTSDSQSGESEQQPHPP